VDSDVGSGQIEPQGHGKTHEDGHWKFATTEAGIAIWGEDVLHFIHDSFR
jgi:hypothetical protein